MGHPLVSHWGPQLTLGRCKWLTAVSNMPSPSSAMRATKRKSSVARSDPFAGESSLVMESGDLRAASSAMLPVAAASSRRPLSMTSHPSYDSRSR